MRDATESTPVLTWPGERMDDRESMDHLRDVVHRLGLIAKQVQGLDHAALALVQAQAWSNAWQSEIVQAASAV